MEDIKDDDIYAFITQCNEENSLSFFDTYAHNPRYNGSNRIVYLYLLVDDLMKICISEKEDTIKTLITLISIEMKLIRLFDWKTAKTDF